MQKGQEVNRDEEESRWEITRGTCLFIKETTVIKILAMLLILRLKDLKQF